MNVPSIVAIIPLYNGGKYIETAINSVLAQTVKPDEFIVVDDGSTDDGPEVVERLARDHPVTLLRKPNGGQSSARNFGVAHSTSALIALLDQDDAWYPNHLEELRRPFLRLTNPVPLGWTYSNLDEVDEKGAMVNRDVLSLISVSHPKRRLVTCLAEDMFILPSASLIARAAFEQVGGFDERLSGYEDDDLFLRMFRAGWDNIFVNKALSKWRVYAGSSSFSARMGRSRMIFFEKLCAAFPDDPPQRLFYVTDLLVPRFARNIFGDYLRALERRQFDRCTAVARDMVAISHRMSGTRALSYRILGSILSSPWLARHGLRIYYTLTRLGFGAMLRRPFGV